MDCVVQEYKHSRLSSVTGQYHVGWWSCNKKILQEFSNFNKFLLQMSIFKILLLKKTVSIIPRSMKALRLMCFSPWEIEPTNRDREERTHLNVQLCCFPIIYFAGRTFRNPKYIIQSAVMSHGIIHMAFLLQYKDTICNAQLRFNKSDTLTRLLRTICECVFW